MINDYQAFTPVVRKDGMPTQEFMLYLAALKAILDAIDARLTAGGL